MVPTTMRPSSDRRSPRKVATSGDCNELGADDIALRRSSFGLSEADESNLNLIRFTIRDDVPGLVDSFYEHLLGQPELRGVAWDPRKLARLRQAQRNYLLTLGLDGATEASVEERLRLGLAHQRAGIEHKYYLGAHAKLFELIAPPLARRCTDRLASVLSTLQRVLAFDAHLVVEAYFRASRRWFEGRVDELSESKRLLVRDSRRDSVTQIDCRPFLLDALEREFDRSRGAAQHFSVLFIDLDHFKGVNDAQGHAAGDDVLRKVVEVVKKAVRPADIVGRYGGDEFLVGLVQAGPATAKRIAERLCRDVLASSGGSDPITVSIGCSTRGVEATLAELIRSADRAMYLAKANGRNRVCAPDSHPEECP